MSTRNKKFLLYIDGTNLFAGQNELFGNRQYLSFKSLMEEIKRIFSVHYTYFYASYMTNANKRKQNFKLAEALFYKEVKSYPKLTFFKGHRSKSSGKEKGVDVHLAVDIVKDILVRKSQNIIIFTGDADFIYPLEIAKQYHAKTAAIFLSNRFSLEIAYKVDKAYVLNYRNLFTIRRKLPRQLKIVQIKSPVCKHTG